MANDEDLHKADICSPVLRLQPIRQSLSCLLFGCLSSCGGFVTACSGRVTVLTEPTWPFLRHLGMTV
jgi:hypothetical protein